MILEINDKEIIPGEIRISIENNEETVIINTGFKYYPEVSYIKPESEEKWIAKFKKEHEGQTYTFWERLTGESSPLFQYFDYIHKLNPTLEERLNNEVFKAESYLDHEGYGKTSFIDPFGECGIVEDKRVNYNNKHYKVPEGSTSYQEALIFAWVMNEYQVKLKNNEGYGI